MKFQPVYKPMLISSMGPPSFRIFRQSGNSDFSDFFGGTKQVKLFLSVPWKSNHIFIGWFPNHHYFSRGLSSSKRNHHFKEMVVDFQGFPFCPPDFNQLIHSPRGHPSTVVSRVFPHPATSPGVPLGVTSNSPSEPRVFFHRTWKMGRFCLLKAYYGCFQK